MDGRNRFDRAAQIIPLLVVLLGVLMLTLGGMTVKQAGMPTPGPLSFSGEYSRDGENWNPLVEGTELSSKGETLSLRGHFDQVIPEDCRVYFYRDHIAAELFINGELCYRDLHTEFLLNGLEIQPAMCSRDWNYWLSSEEVTPEDLVEIRLRTPHSFGNDEAVQAFLLTLCITPDTAEVLSAALRPYGFWFQAVGVLLVILSLLLLGGAIAARFQRVKNGPRLSKAGLLCLFCGGYFFLDTYHISDWGGFALLRSWGWQLCMMFAAYWFGLLVLEFLSGRGRKTAETAMGLSLLLNSALILLSGAGVLLLYDTLPWWILSQWILCPLLLGCVLWELRRAAGEQRPLLLSGVLLLAAQLLDLAGAGERLYSSGTCVKAVFVLLFAWHFVRISMGVVRDHQASRKTERLEKELEENRIALMLSQIQPHFLYNVLGTIRGLCRQDPDQAWKALGDFSVYLRGNMNALDHRKNIPFHSELRHVETYLRLEQMRMGDRLRVVFDIQEKDFFLPPLTVQPLVENAVKHGIFERREGGTVRVTTRRLEGQYEILVQDDGIGFDLSLPMLYDEHTHIGLRNVRSRWEQIMGGTMTVESTPGQGTEVRLRCRVERAEGEGGERP